jgi:hypothetical protein
MSRIPKRKPKHQTEPNINNDQNEQIPIISNQPLPNNNIENDTNLQNQNPSEIINTNNINNQNNNMNEYNYGERLELMRKMKHRHDADGAVNINVEEDDLQTGNYDLYENKDINLEKPKINENISKDNTEYYIESIHHDEFLKIIQQTRKEEESDIDKKKKGIPIKAPIKEKSFQQKIEPQREIKLKKSKRKKPLTSYEMRKLTEKKIFEKFDDELTEIITKTMSKVTLLFLFAQGILAGMGLLHILIMMSMENWENFRKTHGKMVMLMFNIFHTLSFASFVGNGIKFISAYQKYNLIRNKFNRDSITVFTRLKKKMYFSAVLLFFFLVTFVLEVFLARKVQRLNYIGCVNFDEDEIGQYDVIAKYDVFKYYRNFHYIVDVLVILLFILNIFDVNVESNDEKIIQPKVEVTYFMGDLDETYDDDDLK